MHFIQFVQVNPFSRHLTFHSGKRNIHTSHTSQPALSRGEKGGFKINEKVLLGRRWLRDATRGRDTACSIWKNAAANMYGSLLICGGKLGLEVRWIRNKGERKKKKGIKREDEDEDIRE
jgi:hypothetical protein